MRKITLLMMLGLLAFTGMSGIILPSTAQAAEAAYGDFATIDNERTFSLHFTHTVQNTGSSTLHRQDLYALVPQSIVNQTVLGITFDPQPAEFVEDEWGQSVAHYVIDSMPGKSSLEFTWTATVTMADLSFSIDPSTPMDIADIPADILATYTEDDTKYTITSPEVQQAAAEAIANSANLYEQVRDTYQYVIDHLEYSREGSWDDAATVLARGNGSCTEYDFVLIALYRANRIPAQYVGGSRLRADDDYTDTVFHRAVEVYLSGYGWVPADPTLGDTQNDPEGFLFNRYNSHFIMATAGGKSSFLNWNYHSYLKVSRSSEADQVVSKRSVHWLEVSSEPVTAVAALTVTMSTATRTSGKNTFTGAVAEILVVDASGRPLIGATVSGKWSGLTSDSDTAVTNSKGVAVMQSDQVKKASGTFTLTVASVVADGIAFELQGDTVTSLSI